MYSRTPAPLQVQHDSLDRPNPAPVESTPYAPTRRGAMQWRALIALTAIGAGVALLVVWLLAGFLQDLYTYNSVFAGVVDTALIIVVLCLAGAVLAVLVKLAVWATTIEQPGGLKVNLVQQAALDMSQHLAGVIVAMQLHGARRYPNATTVTETHQHKPDKVNEREIVAGEVVEHLMPSLQWFDMLDQAPHLLIYGPSFAGKSTIAQAVTSKIGNCDYVVIDPVPNKPGESKWHGVEFVTIDQDGRDDEYASIKAALAAIDAEDQRRRLGMTGSERVLVVIIDESLGLVDALGTITNEQRQKEQRIAQFIRTKGLSSRHRKIKVILIGQGKNLKDLALKSSTARNNYALVRAERNAATNQRRAYIETPQGDVEIDVSEVVTLSHNVKNSARVWLTHSQAAALPKPAALDQSSDVLNKLKYFYSHGVSRDKAREVLARRNIQFANATWSQAVREVDAAKVQRSNT